ncbi:phosphatidate cytidylyltransferase [Acidocella sp.]|uniref:phosphatidate cytidylyltransferase n=2 Tax=Acidocella sp. TaxID=50710 RepID=UPI0026283ACB|nr:phosphatidate cytidylyltransferase [Acidocella sp.]
MAAPLNPNRWSDIYIRTASALVLGPLALFCLGHGGWAWDGLLAVALIGLGHEWGTLSKLSQPWGLAAVLGLIWGVAAKFGFMAGLGAIGVAMAVVWWRFGRFAGLGVPYAGLGGISLLWLRLRPEVGLLDTAYLVFIIWGTDIGAYLTGRLIGGPKLAPSISPGKTWSGAVGGLLSAALAGGMLAGMAGQFGLGALVWGGVLSTLAQTGDLMESAVKRKLGVKDSGRTIPGHGGLFDRLDGFLTAAPMAVLLAYLAAGGVPLWR